MSSEGALSMSTAGQKEWSGTEVDMNNSSDSEFSFTTVGIRCGSSKEYNVPGDKNIYPTLSLNDDSDEYLCVGDQEQLSESPVDKGDVLGVYSDNLLNEAICISDDDAKSLVAFAKDDVDIPECDVSSSPVVVETSPLRRSDSEEIPTTRTEPEERLVSTRKHIQNEPVHVLSSDSEDSLPPLSVRLGYKPSSYTSSLGFSSQIDEVLKKISHSSQNSEKLPSTSSSVVLASYDEYLPDLNLSYCSANTHDSEDIEDIPIEKATSTEQPVKLLAGKKKGMNKLPTVKQMAQNESKEAKEAAREAKRLERKKAKEEQKKLKEREKLLCRAQRQMRSAEQPSECHKLITVVLDSRMLEIKNGGEILTVIQGMDLKYKIVNQPVAGLVTWCRQAIEDIAVGDDLQVNQVTREIVEDQALINVPVEDFIQMVQSSKQQQYGTVVGDEEVTLLSFYKEIHREVQKKIILMIMGLESYYKTQKRRRNQDFRAAVGGAENANPPKRRKKVKETLPLVTKLDVEEALIELEVETNVKVCFAESTTDVGHIIARLSKAIAESPFRQQKLRQHGFSWYVEGDSVTTVKVAPNGQGLTALWQQQLQQISHVNKDTAQAIVAQYPTLQSLIQAYKNSTPQKAALLLSNILVRRNLGPLATTRRVGKELSWKIYKVITENDDVLL